MTIDWRRMGFLESIKSEKMHAMTAEIHVRLFARELVRARSGGGKREGEKIENENVEVAVLTDILLRSRVQC